MTEIFINCNINANYEVSNLGRLRNKKTNRFLNGYTPQNGYIRFKINNTYYTAGRVIYQSFNPLINIDNFDISYIDNNPKNLKLDNLRTTTRQESTGNQTTRHTNKLNTKNIHTTTRKDRTIKYRVEIRREPVKICKVFYTYNEAVSFRDAKINEIWGEFGNNQ